MSIELKTGDPSSGPATFTRFALPFRYAAGEGRSAGADAPRFRQCLPDDLPARRKYFTPETAGALFDRACWYAAAGAKGERAAPLPMKLDIGHCAGKRAIIDAQLRPMVVLFEAASAFGGGREHHAVLHTGFLLLDVSFAEGQKLFLDDLLLINDYFRYWREPFAGHATTECHYGRDGSDCTATYGAFAASLPFPGPPNDLYTGRWTHFLAGSEFTAAGGRQFSVIPPQWKREAVDWIEQGKGDGGWIASTDERAFVWSCALTPHGSGDFVSPASATHSAEWIRLLNVDRPSAAEASRFEKSWAEARTYTRWEHYGTLYGFNEHSGAMVAEPDERLPLWRHFMGMYFDQELLLLYVRVTTFRLSNSLSQIHADSRKLTDQAGPFRDLRDGFARFANLYQFPLLSTQQQGVEMYTLARQALDIEPLFRDIETQIETTHEYLELRQQADTNNQVKWLTALAAIVVVMTLLLTADPIKDPILERLNHVTRHPRLVLDAIAAFGALCAAAIPLRPIFVSWRDKRDARRGLDT